MAWFRCSTIALLAAQTINEQATQLNQMLDQSTASLASIEAARDELKAAYDRYAIALLGGMIWTLADRRRRRASFGSDRDRLGQ